LAGFWSYIVLSGILAAVLLMFALVVINIWLIRYRYKRRYGRHIEWCSGRFARTLTQEVNQQGKFPFKESSDGFFSLCWWIVKKHLYGRNADVAKNRIS
jgi:hypothetical protein